MSRLKEIEDSIQKLNSEKWQIKQEAEKDDVKWIKSLSWTKEYHATVNKTNLLGYGNPEYQINLSGDIKARCLPKVSSSVNLDFGYYTTTSGNVLNFNFMNEEKIDPKIIFHSKHGLISFLEAHEFKSVSYDTGLLDVLKAAEIASAKSEEDRNWRN